MAHPSHSSLKHGMIFLLIVGVSGCLLFGCLYGCLHQGWLLDIAITFGVTAYHILIRFLSPILLYAFFHRTYDPDHPWFRLRRWETRLYRLLKVKDWKAHAPAYDPSEFSLQLHTAKQLVLNMCHAELVHELIMVLSFTSLLFAIPFGAFPVFFITALLAALFDGIFVMVQRYNHPRIAALAKHSRYSL